MFRHNPESPIGSSVPKDEAFSIPETVLSTEKPKTFWEKIQEKFASYVARDLLASTTMTVKPYELKQDLRPLESFKFNHTVSDKQIYESALKVAEQFGWRPGKAKSPIITPYRGEDITDTPELETVLDTSGDSVADAESSFEQEVSVPLFITNKLKKDLAHLGVTAEELYKLKPEEAWELLQRKTVEKNLQPQQKEQVPENCIASEDALEDFEVLSTMWDSAYEKMQNTSTEGMIREIEDITIKSVGDVETLEKYLRENGSRLSEDERYFVKMSILMKKIRTKVVEDLTDENLAEEIVTDEMFDDFVQTGEVSEDVLSAIADKIVHMRPMSQRELSIYVEKSSEIEAVLRNRVV